MSLLVVIEYIDEYKAQEVRLRHNFVQLAQALTITSADPRPQELEFAPLLLWAPKPRPRCPSQDNS